MRPLGFKLMLFMISYLQAIGGKRKTGCRFAVAVPSGLLAGSVGVSGKKLCNELWQ
jgi:hypothetical protein